MRTARGAVLIAQDLFRRLGPDGIELVAVRVEALRAIGDAEAARFWRSVGRALRLIAAAPSSVSDRQRNAAAGSARQRTLWLLMQRIEGFRHLAAAAEREASAATCTACAEDYLGLASEWRHLATELEGLARPSLG